MARNRMIKVDFWADEKVSRVSLMARLMFIGIWNFCDDSGVCRATPNFIRANIFQHDDFAPMKIDACLKELDAAGLIVIATHSGETFLRVNNFLRHQKINRPSTFRFIPGDDAEVAELFNSVSTHELVSEGSVPKEKEKGKEKAKEKGEPRAVAAPQRLSAYPITPDELVDIFNKKFRGIANPARGLGGLLIDKFEQTCSLLDTREKWVELFDLAYDQRAVLFTKLNTNITFSWFVHIENAIKVLEGKYGKSPLAEKEEAGAFFGGSLE